MRVYGFCPELLSFPVLPGTGYVHRYTYLKTSSDDEEDSEKEETPLSFAFAFTKLPLRKVRIIPSVLFYHTLRTAEKLR
ncbi:hypothetical protein NXX23_09690 [Bacteroides ovatus]|nr:hypothetical protein [Bacteroides ovatus]